MALSNFNRYAYSFGLGHKLGTDIPFEKSGNIPIPSYYNKIFGPRWVSCNIISNAIGQGEVETTLMQLANAMSTIANKGWYYTPHLVDSIENATDEENHMLDSFKVKHQTLDIPDKVFEIVHDGMQGVMEFGTGAAAQVPGIVVCGKTGTVENYYHGIKQQDHAFFGAFAPRNNPHIAIAVMCENAGKGAQSAAPIASLMIEKYLKDSIPEPDRKALVETMSNENLIPARMKAELFSLDSARKVRQDSLMRIKMERAKDSAVNKNVYNYSNKQLEDYQKKLNNVGKQPAKNKITLSARDVALMPVKKIKLSNQSKGKYNAK
jgi:penicillin-binding protein 2